MELIFIVILILLVLIQDMVAKMKYDLANALLHPKRLYLDSLYLRDVDLS